MSAPKISAFVICYNRASILATCLRALTFADELIVVDKSSTDRSHEIAKHYATHVVGVPWTATVEETRPLAMALCSHDWILFMDDDECLSGATASLIRTELQRPTADIYSFPLRHYILGRHDERAYYWPEYHVRLFRRGAVTFSRTVHAGIMRHSDRVKQMSTDQGACIHHLSYTDIAEWIEKTNRYTSRSTRSGCSAGTEGLVVFAQQRLAFWLARTQDTDPNGYPAAVALLRAIYDIIDALKTWEADQDLDGAKMFHNICTDLNFTMLQQSTQ